MANIRSYNNFEFSSLDGVQITNAPVNTVINGVSVLIDDKSISATPKNRHICFKCGGVYDADICECGNGDFPRITLGRWRHSDEYAYSKTCYIKDNNIKSVKIGVQWNIARNLFEIYEEEYDVLTIYNDRVTAYKSNIPAENYCKVLEEFVKRSEWDGMNRLLSKFPYEEYDPQTSYNFDKTDYILLLQNVYNCIPNVENLSRELFYAILHRFVGTSGKFESLTEFYKKNDIPLAIADLYGILGIPSVSSLGKIDKLHPSIIMAIQYALLHQHIIYNDLQFLSNANIEVLNDNCYVFADYFRRNALKFGGKVYDAFLYVQQEGTTNIKDANMIKFTEYLRSKKFKENKIYDFAKNMESGDAISALKALV